MLRKGSFQIALLKISIIIFILISRCEPSLFLYVGSLRATFPRNKDLGDDMSHTPKVTLYSKIAWVIPLNLPAATYTNRPVQPLLDAGRVINRTQVLQCPFPNSKRKITYFECCLGTAKYATVKYAS